MLRGSVGLNGILPLLTFFFFNPVTLAARCQSRLANDFLAGFCSGTFGSGIANGAGEGALTSKSIDRSKRASSTSTLLKLRSSQACCTCVDDGVDAIRETGGAVAGLAELVAAPCIGDDAPGAPAALNSDLLLVGILLLFARPPKLGHFLRLGQRFLLLLP